MIFKYISYTGPPGRRRNCTTKAPAASSHFNHLPAFFVIEGGQSNDDLLPRGRGQDINDNLPISLSAACPVIRNIFLPG
jgi:hypothetical protein